MKKVYLLKVKLKLIKSGLLAIELNKKLFIEFTKTLQSVLLKSCINNYLKNYLKDSLNYTENYLFKV